MHKVLFSAIVFFICTAATNAYDTPEIERKPFYIALDAGMYLPSGNGDKYTYDYNIGYYVGGDFAWYFSKHFGVAAKIARTSSTSKKVRYSLENVNGDNDEFLEFSTIMYMLGIVWRYPVSPTFDISFGGGAVYMDNSIRRYVENKNLSLERHDLSGYEFSYYVDGALKHYFNQTFSMGLTVRYVHDQQEVKNADIIHLSGPSILLSVGFHL